LTVSNLGWIKADTYSKGLLKGNAGTISIDSDQVILKNGGIISSSTVGDGVAGSITVHANTIDIHGIYASNLYGGYGSGTKSSISAIAANTSSGQTGTVTITANKAIHLYDGGEISIQNEATATNPATIKAGIINVSAPNIDLKDSAITAESTGNVNAGKINLNFLHALTLDPSFISTKANTGSGGDITISGGDLIRLQNSGFLTSVSQANGHGGDINVLAHTLIMDNGVIQANAIGGSGGDINLKLQNLIPSQNQLIKGGSQIVWKPFISGFNVIQAASQNGVNGSVNVTSPQFNISGSISGFKSVIALPRLENNPCLSESAHTSSLARNGKGGIATNETKAVFIPAIPEHTDSVKQATTSSNNLSLKESSSCIPI
jgi:hypothetical protein